LPLCIFPFLTIFSEPHDGQSNDIGIERATLFILHPYIFRTTYT
jgi:hypothetical protein